MKFMGRMKERKRKMTKEEQINEEIEEEKLSKKEKKGLDKANEKIALLEEDIQEKENEIYD